MNEYNVEKIVKAKHILPMKAEEVGQLLNMSCTMIRLDPAQLITDIAVSDNMIIHEGCLYIPYNETDQFCTEAIAKGAVAILTDHEIAEIPCIVVDDTASAVYRLCEVFEGSIRLPSVLVAGSEGKTTTKRMVKRVLQQKYNVFSQDGNYNSLHGLCCSLQEVEAGAQIIVQEVDERRTQNTVNCSQILKPDVVLVTNIAEAHIGHLGGKENLIESFRGLTAGLREDGLVILNADDKDSMSAGFRADLLTVGINNPSADCLATNIREKAGGIEFDVSFREAITHVKLSVHGVHNVYNAMMAFVVGKLKGIPEKEIIKGLNSFKNTGIRQNVVHLGNVTVYADCYNASATSVRYAIRCFDSLRAGRGKKVAVLGDIAEIEGYEESTYRQIADCIDRSSIDVLVTCGKDSEQIHSYVTRDITEKHTRDLKELNEYLEELKKSGAGSYLFKASRVMRLEKSIQTVFPKHYDKLMNKPSRFQRWKRRIKKHLHR